MLYYDWIDITEGNDFDKNKCIKRVWYVSKLVLFRKKVQFSTYVCNWCHDILVVSVKLIDIAILKIRGVNYNYIIKRISQSAEVN